MRTIFTSIALMIGSLGLAGFWSQKAQAQAPDNGPAKGDWSSYYNYGPHYYWQHGREQGHAGWEWHDGRHHYPGYHYYAYPQYGTRFYGGGSYYYAPGYYYPRPHDTRPQQ